jgi:hypothetical protein
MSIRVLLTLAGCACALAALAVTATAKQTLSELRVEGPDGTLDPGTWYVTGTERIRKSRPSDKCIRDTGRLKFPGPTALGIPQTGSEHTKAVRQVRVRIDEAGAFICEIGSIVGRPFDPDTFDFAGWLYWQNYVSGTSSADLATLSRGDHVLWVFADFNPDASQQLNTGHALELTGVPARSDGSFEVTVLDHDYDGSTTPADGAEIEGASKVAELGDGRYEVSVPEGRTTLTATRGLDIPSNHVETCFRARPKDCPRAHGKRIFGSVKGDRIKGTRGWDRIATGGGNDRVKIRNGGRDRVKCGGGKGDEVVVKRRDRDDRIARNCERVIGRA